MLREIKSSGFEVDSSCAASLRGRRFSIPALTMLSFQEYAPLEAVHGHGRYSRSEDSVCGLGEASKHMDTLIHKDKKRRTKKAER